MQKKSTESKIIVRFLLVGILNTLFSYSVFSLLVFFDIKADTSLLISYIFGIAFNFSTFSRLVFESSGYNKKEKFIIVYIFLYLLNVLLLNLMQLLITNLYFCQFILLLPMAATTYYLNSKFVFKLK